MLLHACTKIIQMVRGTPGSSVALVLQSPSTRMQDAGVRDRSAPAGHGRIGTPEEEGEGEGEGEGGGGEEEEEEEEEEVEGELSCSTLSEEGVDAHMSLLP
jgi:hypothetical protein